MSARLIKISAAVALVHLLGLSVLWIGFPVPVSKPQVDFVYLGGSVDQPDEGLIKGQIETSVKRIDFDHFDAPTFAPWINLRAVNKPKR